MIERESGWKTSQEEGLLSAAISRWIPVVQPTTDDSQIA
jgi:hypothetical protein